MKKRSLNTIVLLLCIGASMVACKKSNSTLQSFSGINTSNTVFNTDPLSRLFSFTDFDFIYFLIAKNGASVYTPQQ